MTEISYYHQGRVIKDTKGSVPSKGDEIVLASPEETARIWHVDFVRRYNWFDLSEDRWCESASVFLK